MTDAIPLPFDLPSVHRKKLTVDFDGGNQSSDGGLLLLRQAERKLGVCRRLADAMPDRRDPSRICHDDVRDGDGARLGDCLRPRGCHRPRPAAARSADEARGRPLSGQRRTVGLAIDDQSSGECAEQDGGGAAHRRSGRPGRHDREAAQAGDSRHRRHVLCGARRSAACVLERASRRARLRIDAHLSRGERHADGDDPAPGAHAEGHRGEDRHQARDEAHAQTLAEDPHRVARRQPLRPRRGHGMG